MSDGPSRGGDVLVGGYGGADALFEQLRTGSLTSFADVLERSLAQSADRRALFDFISAQNTTNERIALALALVANPESNAEQKSGAMNVVLEGLRAQAKISAHIVGRLFSSAEFILEESPSDGE